LGDEEGVRGVSREEGEEGAGVRLGAGRRAVEDGDAVVVGCGGDGRENGEGLRRVGEGGESFGGQAGPDGAVGIGEAEVGLRVERGEVEGADGVEVREGGEESGGVGREGQGAGVNGRGEGLANLGRGGVEGEDRVADGGDMARDGGVEELARGVVGESGGGDGEPEESGGRGGGFRWGRLGERGELAEVEGEQAGGGVGVDDKENAIGAPGEGAGGGVHIIADLI